ncbi:MAG: MarR family transcriptional regulator [Desulfovibrionaceae bacterium]|nr:MarR family transcriptional regulator [Desulfovibrionaceae bacterium]
MLTNDDELFFHRLCRLQRAYAGALSRRLEPHGVKPGYLAILESLWLRDNVTQKELHATLDIEQATLSSTLQRMERDGLLTRERLSQDRRITRIALTERGQGLNKAVQASLADAHTLATSGLTVNDRRYFYRILKQIAEHLDADAEDDTLILLDEVED